MDLLSWWKSEAKGSSLNNSAQSGANTLPGSQLATNPKPAQRSKPKSSVDYPEIPGMNGAVAVSGAGEKLPVLTVIEFGSVAAANSPFTVSGYCPVWDDLEPCVWQLDPPSEPNEPLFRVVF